MEFFRRLKALCALFPAIIRSCIIIQISVLCSGCDYFGAPSAEGSIVIRFAGYEALTKGDVPAIPDTSDFLLHVSDSEGKPVYEGTFGNSPDEIFVEAGTYLVSVRSAAFEKPAWNAPVYGDDRCVEVLPGERTDVCLVCSLVNSGIRLCVEDSFASAYPDGSLSLSSSLGTLEAGYDEARIAYFDPGVVSLLLETRSGKKSLFSKNLEARQIVRINLSSSSGAQTGGGVSVVVDTSAIWDDINVDADNGSADGSSIDSAMDVGKALVSAPAKDVWVYGYIVGSFKSTSKVVFESPYPSATNLAISGRPSAADVSSCLSVELKKGSVRDALNLIDNPGLKGRKVFLRGDLAESYYSIPGIKNITAFELRQP